MRDMSSTEAVHPAVALARMGFRVFPLHGIKDGKCTCPNPKCVSPDGSPGKHPRAEKWQQKASSDPETVTRAFRPFQHANIGIVTGSGLFVLDVDGPPGEESLRELQAKHGSLPPTRESITGRGRHLFYHCPKDVKITTRTAIAPKLDVRGDGGYAAGPGSVHENGNSYRWKDEHVAIADAPAWLLDLLRSKSSTADTPADEPILQGERNSKLFDLVCSLFREGVSAEEVMQSTLATNATRCVPPLPESDIRDMVARVADSNIPASAEKRKIALHWFKLDAQELLSDMNMIKLTDAQLGWRMRLVSYAWLNRGKLPSDVGQLIEMARPSSKPKFRKEYKAVLFDFLPVFENGESFLVNGKLKAKHSDASDKWTQQQLAGMASGQARADKRGAA
jgi:hypothetical protein